jgi:hypothetical protein
VEGVERVERKLEQFAAKGNGGSPASFEQRVDRIVAHLTGTLGMSPEPPTGESEET